MNVSITIDVEQDCPPFTENLRGMTEGMPKLLDLFKEKGIKATFFTTGEMAEKFPETMNRLVDEGHELGSHGHTHPRFDRIDSDAAQEEIGRSTEILRRFYPVTSFRAPYLQFPEKYLKYLSNEDYKIDSSLARHKNLFVKSYKAGNLLRVPVSTTSIVLRLPKIIRNLMLGSFRSPVVLFVHPWEFVDLRREKLRFDCRYNTGDRALAALSETIDFYKSKGANFLKMEEFSAT